MSGMAMVKGIDVRGMQHCETTALGVLLRHEGLDLSEPMLFGLGSGLSLVPFGGHVVAMYGYDEQGAYLVDTDPQGGAVSTSLAGLARARAERGPMTAKHRSFTVTAPSGLTSPQDRIIPAIKTCTDAFLSPPIANLGHRGIEKAAKLVSGESGDAKNLMQAGSILHELSRIERDAMQTLSTLQGSCPSGHLRTQRVRRRPHRHGHAHRPRGPLTAQPRTGFMHPLRFRRPANSGAP